MELDVDMVVLATGMVPVTKDDPIVNLAYRQGPGFRDNELFDDYADSNYICFPYETQRTGIYAAGCIRRFHSLERGARPFRDVLIHAFDGDCAVFIGQFPRDPLAGTGDGRIKRSIELV